MKRSRLPSDWPSDLPKTLRNGERRLLRSGVEEFSQSGLWGIALPRTLEEAEVWDITVASDDNGKTFLGITKRNASDLCIVDGWSSFG